jgi:uncharacterized protein YdcH (DUF465 family)
MHDDANEPVVVSVPSHEETGPAARWRAAVLLGIGGGVGLALGVLLTISVSTSLTFLSPTLPLNRDAVQVFNELNELRQQINRLNEERKLKDQETVDAIRQALSAAASTARPGESGTPGALAPAKGPGGGADKPRVGRPWDPLAELDEEIKRLEDTQKVLNTILDLFTPKAKERAKDRPAARESPE